MVTTAETLVSALRNHAETIGETIALHDLVDGDVDGTVLTETYAGLDMRARKVAAVLQQNEMMGERALLLYPPGTDFITGFFGCLYAGTIAVPAYPPDPSRLERTLPRLRSIVKDSSAKVVLTTQMIASLAESMFPLAPELREVQWIATDTIEDSAADLWSPFNIVGADVAFLQYTSGSTGTPRGVKVTHGNLVHNSHAILRLREHSSDSVIVSWLPCYHDMGLIGGILQPLFAGSPAVLMSPIAFLQKPMRWLRAITHFRGTGSAFPNFALDLCVRKATEQDLAKLDLSSWREAWNGAEPVRQTSLENFSKTFEPAGFRAKAICPVYGLAESTLIATGGRKGELPRVRKLHKGSLSQRKVREVRAVDTDFATLVSCGSCIDGQQLVIVDPEKKTKCADDEVGEIWLRGPSVAAGYWNRPDESRETFEARLSDTGEGPFLRTGDLGFLRDGELYVAGRIKDVIVLRGANYYPQDVEEIVEKSHQSIRPGSSAAVGLDRGEGEHLAVAVEVRSGLSQEELTEVAQAMRAAVATATGVTPETIALIPQGSLPKTSSGKVQRHASRDGLLSGALQPLLTLTLPRKAEPKASSPGVYNRVVDALVRASGYARELFQPQTKLVSYIGFDSLLITSIVADLEESFGPLGEELFSDVDLTVEKLVRLVEENATIPFESKASDKSGTDAAESIPVTTKTVATEQEFRIDDFHEVKDIRSTLMLIDALEIKNPYFRQIDGPARDTARMSGRDMLNFATYNYLGLVGDPRVNTAAIKAIEHYGTSASASRVASGDRKVHRDLENEISQFLGCEDTLIFASGHATNVTTIGALVGRGDLIVHDSLAHDSLLGGAKLSGARRVSFAHNDMEALERVLKELRPAARRVLIVVEGAYSMDGDLAPLNEIIALKKKYNALLMVDEAHSIGCIGKTGRGIGEVCGVARNDVDVWMGTLSKSLASCGGFVAGSRTFINYLKYTGGGFVYAAAISPANAAAALEALRILQAEPERVTTLQKRAAFFLNECKARGLDTAESDGTAIVPIIVGASVRCLQMSEALAQRGISVPPILYPAVEEERARLRFFVSALHTEEQLKSTAAAIAEELEKRMPKKAARAVSIPPVSKSIPPPAGPRTSTRPPPPDRHFKRVFLTGASGFIGSRVAKILAAKGVEIVCLLRPTSKTHRLAKIDFIDVRGDLNNKEAIAKGMKGCDAVIHLACTSSWSDIRTAGAQIEAVAVDGTRNVLEAAKAAGVERFVHVSSVTALNGSDYPEVFDESATYSLSSRNLPYSHAKHRAENVVREFADKGLDVVVASPAEVYGPDDDAMITAGNILEILNASPPAACDGGTSIAHVDDVADGIVASLYRGRRGERYILGGENVSLHDLMEKVLKLAGRRASIVDIPNDAAVRLCHLMNDSGLPPPIPMDVLDYATLYWFVDSKKAQRELGYRPRSADDTLKPVVDWLREKRAF